MSLPATRRIRAHDGFLVQIHECELVGILHGRHGSTTVRQEECRVRTRVWAEIDAAHDLGSGDVNQDDVPSRAVIWSIFRCQGEAPIGGHMHFMRNDRADRDTRDLDLGREVKECDTAAGSVGDQERPGQCRGGRRTVASILGGRSHGAPAGGPPCPGR